MWIGIIVGLALGAATRTIEGIISLPIFLGFIGAIISRLVKNENEVTAETKWRTELEVIQEDLRRANRRIDELDRRLLELVPPGTAAASGAEAAPPKATEPKAWAPEPIIVNFSTAEDTPSEEEDAEAAPVEGGVTPPPPPAPPSKPIPLFTHDTTQPERISQPIVFSVPQVKPAATTAAPSSTPAAPQPPRSATPDPPPPPQAPGPEFPQLPEWLTGFVQRWVIGGNPIVKIGVLILFLGLAFLLRYVAEHTTVRVEFRYAGVAAIGIGLLLFGWRVREKADNYGVILQGAGIGVLYLTTLAGMKIHPLIPPQLGFALLIGVAAFAVMLAVMQDALSLAVAAALGGFAAPVLASTGSENHLAFFSYLALLNIGIAAVAWFKAWRLLNLIGFISTVFLVNGWGQQYYTPALFNLAEPFLLSFFVLYVLIAFLFARRTLADAPEIAATNFVDQVRQTAPKVSYVDGSLVFGVPMATFGMQYLIVRSFENGPAYSALGFGLTYIFLAFALFRGTGRRYALLSETMVALAVIFGSLAIPLGLEGKWTSAAWAVEAAGVYWLGLRQQRIHARVFALLLIAGAATYFALDLGFDFHAVIVIAGSWLGCVMLAASVWTVYWLLSRAREEEVHALERHLQPVLVAFGCLLVALLPFMLLKLEWASAALAVLGVVAVYAARPLAERALIGWGSFYQLLAGALFASTLNPAREGTALAGGWLMLAAAALIAAAMFATTWTARKEEYADDDELVGLSGLSILVLLGALVFANVAPLFVMEWRFAAMIWAAASVATMWWGLRASRAEAVLAALGLQVAAGAIGRSDQVFRYFDPGIKDILIPPFLHSGFWLLAIIAVTASISAYILHRREEATPHRLGWGLLAWSIAWWAMVWEAELARLVPRDTGVMALVALAVATVALWWALARFAKWRQAGQTTLIYLPVLAFLFYEQVTLAAAHPLAGWGALAWPLALAMHVVLLRGQREWLAPWVQKAVHVGGAWFFIVVTSIELQWQFTRWGGEGSAWAMLGLLLVPLAYLLAVTSEAVRSKWPLRDFRDSYTLIITVPVVLFMFDWVAITAQMGNGSAPLPHMPVLNPIELGQIAVLMAVAMWWRSLLEHPVFQRYGRYLGAVLGLAAFGVVTSMVLRTCHQWGGVAWEEHALTSSMMVQTSLSIVWGTIAIALMLLGHFRSVRLIWIMGAGLVAVVVGKLFLVELAAHGSLERIVSFMVVGLLLLLVGYFAPLPPRQETQDEGQATRGEHP